MSAKQLYEDAVERGETYESAGAGKASEEDIAFYIEEIAAERGLSAITIANAKREGGLT